ncbi:MAG: hypothetical protein IJU70_12550 [Lentisphaeria bacterium]|nr:hypothetical protein [Lentisphaeria bacterium]
MEIFLSANRIKSMNAGRNITSAVLTYHTRGALPEEYSDEQVLRAVLDAAPPRTGAAELISASVVEYHGAGVYEIEVSYEYTPVTFRGRLASRRPRDENWYMAGSNTTEHTLTALETTAWGDNAPSAGNLVNWNGRTGPLCAVSGADIINSTVRENCLLTIHAQDYTSAFRRKIATLTGSVNDRVFHGWAAGEVLFLGCNSGLPGVNDRGEELIDVTFKFAIRRNRDSLLINGKRISAAGWDVVWPLGTEFVYTSRVYPRGDLNLLGVGR